MSHLVWLYSLTTAGMVLASLCLPADAPSHLWFAMGMATGVNAWMAFYYFLGGR